MTTCSRFAPSPTGYLHIGGARTALYAWLYAKKTNGKFILRIEDTDRERSTEAAIEVILDGMQWLGLDYDGPYFQTKHFDRYQVVAVQLLAEGKAYKCYCSKDRLDKLREQQMQDKQKPRYDGLCRNLATAEHPADQPYVIRFKTPQTGSIIFEDDVRGHIEVQNSELDDLIIYRSDGTPTYNFTVVIDDMDMQVTHVIRGEDHINNTPRQINIFNALNFSPPVYAHVPMILGEDGKKLSKRHGAVSVMQYRDDGFLPEALLNYLVRLGWSHGDQEIFSREEMIQFFDSKDINKAASQFNLEKLLWLNQHYIKTLDRDYVAQCLAWHMQNQNINLEQGPTLHAVVEVQADRCKTLKEMAEISRYFFEDFEAIDETAAKKHLRPVVYEPLMALRNQLGVLSSWEKDAIHAELEKVIEKFELKLGKIAQPIRVAVTGNTVSPSIDITMALIGKDRVLARIDKALKYIEVRKAADNA